MSPIFEPPQVLACLSTNACKLRNTALFIVEWQYCQLGHDWLIIYWDSLLCIHFLFAHYLCIFILCSRWDTNFKCSISYNKARTLIFYWLNEIRWLSEPNDMIYSSYEEWTNMHKQNMRTVCSTEQQCLLCFVTDILMFICCIKTYLLVQICVGWRSGLFHASATELKWC